MIGRLAGNALGFFTKGVGKGEMAARLMGDGLGGLMAAAYTPGDLGDKLIAGAASTVGGAAGGLVLGKLGGGNPIAGLALDFAGSVGGDIGASMLGEQVMKAKSAAQGEGFLTPYEKLGKEQQDQLAAAIKQDMLRQYGMAVPGAPMQYIRDDTQGIV